MFLSLSTNWNSRAHEDGHAVVAQILATGAHALELGYSLRSTQAEQISEHVRSGEISVSSVHAFCPVPAGFFSGHPELYDICGGHWGRERRAVEAVLDTARFAASMGAKVVVLHAGRVPIQGAARRLRAIVEEGHSGDQQHQKILTKAMDARDRRRDKPFAALHRSLDQLIPQFQAIGVTLALENLPSIDAMPDESEMEQLLREYDSPFFGYWHDIGHGQIRENLGIINHVGIVRRRMPRIAGMHIHDVIPPLGDHQPPPRGGGVRFDQFHDIVAGAKIPFVLEPAPDTPEEFMREAVDFITRVWA